ncbi:hypothetical protein ACFTZB_37460 [Rhodococcus sp. NPDC057014]
MTETRSPGLVPNTVDEFRGRVAVGTDGGHWLGKSVYTDSRAAAR